MLGMTAEKPMVAVSRQRQIVVQSMISLFWIYYVIAFDKVVGAKTNA
jgi:hypothetical protein